MHTYNYICVCVYIYVCMYIIIYISIYLHTYTYMCVYIYICVHVYTYKIHREVVCVYVCTNLSREWGMAWRNESCPHGTRLFFHPTSSQSQLATHFVQDLFVIKIYAYKWLIHMSTMTHLCVLMYVCDKTRPLESHDICGFGASFFGVSCVWHDICVTWLTHIMWLEIWVSHVVHICDMTPSYVWHDSFIRMTWLVHAWNTCKISKKFKKLAPDICVVLTSCIRPPLWIM